MFTAFAERLYAAVGASPAFIDDVIGDLIEETHAPGTGRRAGRPWLLFQLLSAFPPAVRDGVRGVGMSLVIDWAQKAVAAWVLLGTATILVGGMVQGVWSAFIPLSSRSPLWIPSDFQLTALLLAGAARYVLLGYTAAWMDRGRPLLVVLLAAFMDATVHTLVLRQTASDVGPLIYAIPAVSAMLIMAGGLWRVLRHDSVRLPRVGYGTAEQHRG